MDALLAEKLSLLEAHLSAANRIVAELRKTQEPTTRGTSGRTLSAEEVAGIKAKRLAKIIRNTTIRQ